MPNPKADPILHEALIHHEAGRFDKALPLYARVLALDPDNVQALQFSGALLALRGQLPQALINLTKALNKNPRNVSCALALGHALHQAGRNEHARQVLEHGATIEPKEPDLWTLLIGVYKALGQTQPMLAAAAKVAELKPTDGAARARIGELAYDALGWTAAEPHFREAAKLAPKEAMIWANLGICLVNRKNLDEAKDCFERALKLDPKLPKAHAGRGIVLERNYEIEEAVRSFRRSIQLDPKAPDNRSCLLMNLHYLDGVSREELLREHKAYGAATLVPDKRPAPRPLPLPGTGRLRIGFFSPDFRAHSVSYFAEPLLRHLDRSRFELFLYHDHAVCDWMTERLRPLADQWRHVAGLAHEIVVQVLRGDGLDLLIDLTGHTGFNRLQLFAQGLAPVQATYLGYPDTTGLPAMNFRITDARADPPGDAEAFCTETLVRMPRSAWCFTPHPRAPEPVPPPCIQSPDTPPAFGCFNNYSKVTDSTLAAWARLLAAVPASRLLLKNHGLDSPAQQSREESRFKRLGIDPARVELLGRTEKMEDHLATYHRVDVALDSFPYHGTTTTCEALWMGVPVVTLAGDRHASRVGASLLNSAGHPEWIAKDWDHYVATAAALAGDRTALACLRQRLREDMKKSALCDHAGQARDFGACLLQMLGLQA